MWDVHLGRGCIVFLLGYCQLVLKSPAASKAIVHKYTTVLCMSPVEPEPSSSFVHLFVCLFAWASRCSSAVHLLCPSVYVSMLAELKSFNSNVIKKNGRSRTAGFLLGGKLDLRVAMYFCDLLCEELEAIIRTNQQRMQDREVCLF